MYLRLEESIIHRVQYGEPSVLVELGLQYHNLSFVQRGTHKAGMCYSTSVLAGIMALTVMEVYEFYDRTIK